MLTVGVALEQVRVDPGAGAQLLVVAVLAVVLVWLGVQSPLEGARPSASQSLLIVTGLLASWVALVRLAAVLGAELDGEVIPAGAFVWTALVQAGIAGAVAVRRNSAIAALLAAVALGVAVLTGWRWIFGADSATPYRWLALLLATGFAVASLPLRGASLRHAVQMVNAAGLAILLIPVLAVLESGLFRTPAVPTFWELVLVLSGFALVAYAGVDRQPGPAYLGVAVLGSFVALQTFGADRTLEWWPLILILVGAGTMLTGLRPRTPLPPDPEAHDEDQVPLTARSEGDVRVRVHRD